MRRTLVAVAGVALNAGIAGGQQATQVVQFRVNPVSEIAVSGTPAPLVVGSAIAGSAPTSATSSGTTWAISTNESNQKVIASIDAIMPTGLSLEVALAAPAGASSRGLVPLGTSGADVVTGISTVAASALPISYRLSATPSAPVSSAQTRTVTFTIVSGV